MNIKEFFLGTSEEQVAADIKKTFESRTHLRQSQLTQLQDASRITRRLFLRRVLVLGGSSIVAVSGAAIIRNLSTPNVDNRMLSSFTEQNSEASKRLSSEIDALPSSIIKELLIERVKPFYLPNSPSIIDYDGLKIKVSPGRVITENIPSNDVWGSVYLFSEDQKKRALYPLEQTTRYVPYLIPITPEEYPQFFFLERTNIPLIPLTFSTDQPFNDGISPTISISSPTNRSMNLANRESIRLAESSIYIKEACSHLFGDLFIMEMAIKSHELGLDVLIDARTVENTITKAEIITPSFRLLNNARGRLNASMDFCGALLAMKALEGTAIGKMFAEDLISKGLYNSMLATNLGTNRSSILSNAFKWVMSTPEVRSISFIDANLSKLP